MEISDEDRKWLNELADKFERHVKRKEGISGTAEDLLYIYVTLPFAKDMIDQIRRITKVKKGAKKDARTKPSADKA